jgi:CO/xanthine dehydrogenase Mo-binding subunit
LIERACLAIRKQRFRDPLPIAVTKSYEPSKTKGWNNTMIDQNALSHLAWAAAIIEVEIDPIEYIPKVRGIWMAVDGGKILSEQRAKHSLKTAIIQALGWASLEKLSYKEGKLSPDNLSNYSMPAIRDFPPISIDFSWNDSLLPRGIGELPFNTIPAAYAQAVTQAADHHFNTLPLISEDVWQALSSKEKREGDPA